MRKSNFGAAVSCVGAVIGAGFASGREIIVFFTRYGSHAWWLIASAVGVMTALCLLCMNAAARLNRGSSWSGLVEQRILPKIMSLVLMMITAGAMIAASGHMTALLWDGKQAYGTGALGTLCLAWLLGFRSLKPLGWFSTLLTAALLAALLLGYAQPRQSPVVLEAPPDVLTLAGAALRAIGYAAMNMTLAIGVVCGCAQKKGSWMTAALFGWMMAVLLLMSSGLYSLHPELADEAFPFVKLYAVYGRRGYVFSVILLYLSILTTLISIMYGLRTAVADWTSSPALRVLLVLAVPMAVSRLGFAQIVDRMYAPAGLACLAIIYLPLAIRAYRERIR